MSIDEQTKQHDDRALYLHAPRLTDEAAAQLVDWLYELALSAENSYLGQLRQYHREREQQQRERQYELFNDDL